MRFYLLDSSLVASVLEMIPPYYYSRRKSPTIGACFDLDCKTNIFTLSASCAINSRYRIRGALGSMATFVRSTGYMTAIIVGSYVEYTTVPFLFIGLPVVFFVVFLFLPNTPPYLIRVGKYEVGVDSLRVSSKYNNHICLSTGSQKIDSLLQGLHW